jgi:hypothetical protein
MSVSATVVFYNFFGLFSSFLTRQFNSAVQRLLCKGRIYLTSKKAFVIEHGK